MRRFKQLIVLLIGMVSILVLTACSSQTAYDGFNLYKESWENKDYEKMYSILSQSSKEYISKEEFIDRYTTIYDGIGAKEISINVKEDEEDKESIEFDLKMDTLAGEISQDDYKIEMVKEKNEGKDGWFLVWDESLILPHMEKDDKVRVETIEATRGEIYDRDGNGLAINGSRYSVGIHPAKYEESNTSTLANLLDIDEEIIDKGLEKNTNPEHFVPIVKIALEDEEMLGRLLEIEGVTYQKVNDRVYPGGEALGSLVGYIRPITAEELEKDEEGVYSSTSLVGKAGLETVYEKTLRAQNGRKIYISKIKNWVEVEKIVLAETAPKDGQDLKVTIDSELQKKIYNEMNGDIGASTAIDPKTGEILAMVSSPSFDSNLYTTYIPNAQREEWENMDVNVFENKFNKAYSPGSTFKILTSAIGLENGSIDPSKKTDIQGKGWQKDTSWGDYKINRVNERFTDIDLNSALVYSDNIYFAMAALEIGEKDFIEGAKKFGFDEELPITYPMARSQIINDEKFDNEILLADTGYGQGQVLMSPLHLTMIYSSLVNDGNIMEPILEKQEDTQAKVWKEKVISSENKTRLLNSFINVIEDKDGTGHGAKLDNIKLAGKTGTAELKLSQDDRGQENGWFVSMNVDEPKIVISMMIEGVEDRGGSHHVVAKVKNIMKYYLEGR